MELPSKQKPGPVLQNNGRTVPKAFQKLRAASPITCQVSVPGGGRTISKEGLWAPGGPWNSLPTLPHHSVPCIPVQPSLDAPGSAPVAEVWPGLLWLSPRKVQAVNLSSIHVVPPLPVHEPWGCGYLHLEGWSCPGPWICDPSRGPQ